MKFKIIIIQKVQQLNMDLRKTAPEHRGSPLRHPYGAPAGVHGSNRHPYDQDPSLLSQSRDGSFMASQGPPQLYQAERALDDRHEELKRQIAVKERLLNDMTHERESGRRLRYLNKSQGSSRSQFTVQKAAPPMTDQQFKIETRNKKKLSKSNDRATDSQFIGMRSTNFTGHPTRNNDRQLASTVVGQAGSGVQQASPQQLQFHPSKMQTYHGSLRRSPLRDKRGPRSGSQHSQSPIRGSNSPPRQLYGQSKFAQSFNVDRVVRNSPLKGSPIPTRTVRIEPTPIAEPVPVPVPAPIVSGSFDVRNRLYQERVESLTMDNAALQRRLHQLNSDLADTKREIDRMLSRLRLVDGANQNMDHSVNTKDELDRTNQVMQQDLDRLRHANAIMQEDNSKNQLLNATAIRNLDNATLARKNLESEANVHMNDLQQKMEQMRRLNAEIEGLFTQSNMAQAEIESLTREDMVHNQHIGDISQGIQRMQVERDDIAGRVGQITRQLDDMLNSNETDRHQLELKRRWQTKLVTSKIMQQVLEKLLRSRAGTAFHELRDYSQFDKLCHQKLQALGKALNRIGLRKQAKALHQWYDVCLKPLAFREQNSDIALMIECNRLQSKVFHAWVNYINDQKHRVNMKYHGLDQILAIFKRNQRQQVKRGLDIWKEGVANTDTRYLTVKTLMRRIHERSIRRAWTQWVGYNSLVEQDVRTHILKLTFTQRIHLSHTFHQLRQATHTMKTMRIRRLRLVMKGWRKFVRYNRQLMLVNMSAIQFVKGNRSALLKAMFDELKRNKESRKFKLLHHAVTEDMDPAISGLEQGNYQTQEDILNYDKLRACNAVKDAMAKRLYSYFRKWTRESGHYKVSLRSQVANRIRKNYNNNLIWALKRWKYQVLKRETQMRNRLNQELYQDVDRQSSTANNNEMNLRQKEELHRTAKRIIIDKTMRKLMYRKLAVALGRWMDICNLRTGQEQRFASIILRHRNRNLRRAFDQYVWFLNWSRQHHKNLAGADSLFYKIKLRQLQKTFNGMTFYTNRNKRARRYWNKILHRMDQFIKKRHMTIWRFHSGVKFEFELDQNQNSVTDLIYRRNQLICSMEKHTAEQEEFIAMDTKLRRNKAYRQLGNYFMRTQMTRMQEFFRRWRETIQEQRHKQKICRRTMEHYKRHKFDICARAFKKMMNRQRQAEFQAQIEQRRQEQNDVEHQRQIELATHDNYKQKHQMTAQEIQDSISLRVNTQSKLANILERRQREWVHISRKREVFNALRNAGKKHNAFCQRVAALLERSLLYKGLFCIKEAAETHDFTNRVQRRLRLLSQRFGRYNQADAFNKWKMYSLALVDQRQKARSGEMEERINEFDDYMKQVKKVNAARCFNILQQKNLSNIFVAMRNACSRLKQLRLNEEEFIARQAYRQRRNAIERWNLRKAETLKCRQQVRALRNALAYKLMRHCFNGLKRRNMVQRRLAHNLSDLEKLMRSKIFFDAFHNIRAFGLTKNTYTAKRQRHALQRMGDLCRNRYTAETKWAFDRYKNKVQVTCFKGHQAFATIIKKYANKGLRATFAKWKKKDDKLKLVWANYDVGPCRVDFWEANREIENLKQFMREERFSETAIDNMVQKAADRNSHLMRKFMIRMKIRPSVCGRAPWLPHFFDRWKQYIALRKTYRETFRECCNRTHPVRADLQAAFNMWKYKPVTLRKNLDRLSTRHLTEIGLMTTKKVGSCAEHLYENQSVANHLMIQRDEFLNYYIKSQVLAMALLKDRAKISQMEAWNRWANRRRRTDKQELMRDIRDASYLHANLQARKKQLEQRNTELKTENVSMGSLTTDQQVVYKNNGQLEDAVAALRADIGETDQDYAALLAENARLKAEVAKVEGRDDKPRNRKYEELNRITRPKDAAEIENEPNLFTASAKGPKDETISEKKAREQKERFERLAAKAGSGIR